MARSKLTVTGSARSLARSLTQRPPAFVERLEYHPSLSGRRDLVNKDPKTSRSPPLQLTEPLEHHHRIGTSSKAIEFLVEEQHRLR